jgi:hypothetical protein
MEGIDMLHSHRACHLLAQYPNTLHMSNQFWVVQRQHLERLLDEYDTHAFCGAQERG